MRNICWLLIGLAIYFGYGREHHVLGLITYALLAIVLVWTAPNRWGAGIALHYLSRVFWPDPADPVPAAHPPELTGRGDTKTQRS